MRRSARRPDPGQRPLLETPPPGRPPLPGPSSVRKALTLKHPWPWAICRLGKGIENRTWQPTAAQLAEGDWFAIHGGREPEGSELAEVLDVARGLAVLYADRVPSGSVLRDTVMPGIVAVCRFGGVIDALDPGAADPWFGGPLGWVLAETIMLPTPVPCRGAQGLWDLPDDLRRLVCDQLGLSGGPPVAPASPPEPSAAIGRAGDPMEFHRRLHGYTEAQWAVLRERSRRRDQRGRAEP